MRASDVLDVPPEALDKYLLAKEGARLERGAPLLKKPSVLGRSKVYRCPADGTLVRVRDGCLVLQRLDQIEEVRAMVSGRVVSVIPERGVIIEATGSLVQAAWDSGKSTSGRLQQVVASADEAVTLEHVGPEAVGAVYIAGLLEQPDVLDSLEERGARGLVTGSMPAALCARASELGFPVFLSEGVGRRPMAEPIFELLQRSEGREVSLLASSSMHRPQRAEIIIPLPTTGQVQAIESDDLSLQTGSLVRVNGLKGGTAIGRVARTHSQPRRTAIGGLAAGADIVLSDGQALFVPYPNLDLIG
jgi:hypothetical protein